MLFSWKETFLLNLWNWKLFVLYNLQLGLVKLWSLFYLLHIFYNPIKSYFTRTVKLNFFISLEFWQSHMKRKQEKRTENTNNATAALLNTLNLTKDSLKKYLKEHNTGNPLDTLEWIFVKMIKDQNNLTARVSITDEAITPELVLLCLVRTGEDWTELGESESPGEVSSSPWY